MSTTALFAGRYQLLGALGSGGSAHTFRAHDRVTGARVALKVLQSSEHSAAFRAEFARLRELSHPHVMRVFAYGRARLGKKSVPYYAAELIEGTPFDARWAAVHAAPALHAAVLGVLSALSFLHRTGLCHGDVKPENVLVDAQGRAVLVDLGCAVPVGSRALVGGTPGFLAPELALGGASDERTDLFALGVLLARLPVLDDALKRLGEACRALDPTLRPSSAEAALQALGVTSEHSYARLGRGTAFVGRSGERAYVRDALAAVTAQQPGARVLWIEAPRGSGSSRFVEEASFAAGESWEVLALRADEETLSAFFERSFDRRAHGPEALVEAVVGVAQQARLIVVHDFARADEAARDELTLAMNATPDHARMCWLVSSSAPPPPALAQHGVARITLGPLAADELAAWAGALVPASRIAALLAHTGGIPRAVDRTLAALASGGLSVEALGASDAADELGLRASLAGLATRELSALVRVALGTARESPQRLCERGLVRHTEHGPRLAVPSDREALLALLPATIVRRESASAADRILDDAEPEARAERITHLVRSGRIAQAAEVWSAEPASALRAPRAFARVGEQLCEVLSGSGLVLLARLQRSAGEPLRALPSLARARRRAADSALSALRIEAAECYLALGRPRRARRQAERAQPATGERDECLVRILTRLGAYAEAEALAEARLVDAGPALSARLCEGRALALSYLGEHQRAAAALEKSTAFQPAENPRSAARSQALAGFLALRAGEPDRALPAYESALASAEAAGLSDLVANALLNSANARQMLGHLGSARTLYTRALQMCGALGRAQSVQHVRTNLANLALECGAFGEAEQQLERLAREPVSAEITCAITRYRIELCLWTERAAAALELVDQTKTWRDIRARTECQLFAVEAHVRLAEPARARAVLAGVTTDDTDLALHAALVTGQLLRAENRLDAGIAELERALASARGSKAHPLLPRLECALADLYDDADAPGLAHEQRQRARTRWERVALELPFGARDAFWAHPMRAGAQRSAQPRDSDGNARGMERLIALSRRINAQRTVDDVLSFALDAALELTRAGRGFVLIRDGEGARFEVKCARQLEQDALQHGPLAWSRSIAERVIEGGEAVMTLDAAHDPRFREQASVHAMGLTAVLCVPIHGARALRGALYLDHRYVRARFTNADAMLATALAEQVAVALANAQLFVDLAKKQRELLQKQRRVEELLSGKEREVEALTLSLERARKDAAERTRYREIVGDSPAIKRVFSVLDRVAEGAFPVLVLGESGTGKELVARACHAQSARAAAPFVAVNCGALPDPLLESELFGHVRGAFTGADRDRPGLFSAAHGGTLFLDEIGELSAATQAKLLRVLNDGKVRPVGGTREQLVDARIIAATHRDLRAMVAAGSFREDLFYRLSVVELRVPALRERREDILAIAESVLARRTAPTGEAKRLAPDAVRALLQHAFPGNVRELENALLRGCAMSETRVIHADDLQLEPMPVSAQATPARSRREHDARTAAEIVAALERERWNVSRAAALLGIPRNTFYRKLARLGIALPR